MCGPRTENLNAETGDSSCDNQHPRVSIQTEWSHVQGTNYQESAEESSKLRYGYMIGRKVWKRFGQKKYEGAVDSYNTVTDKFKVVYDNGYYVEIEGDDLISYIVRHSNKDNGEYGSPSARAQLSRQLPPRCTTEKMTTDSNNEGRERRRPLMMRAINAGGSGRPSRARKHRVQSSSGKRLRRKNVNQTAPQQPSTDVGIGGMGRTRALRMRAQNARDISVPRQAGKRRVRHSSKKSLLCEELKRSAYIYYNPGADEDDEDPDWEE